MTLETTPIQMVTAANAEIALTQPKVKFDEVYKFIIRHCIIIDVFYCVCAVGFKFSFSTFIVLRKTFWSQHLSCSLLTRRNTSMHWSLGKIWRPPQQSVFTGISFGFIFAVPLFRQTSSSYLVLHLLNVSKSTVFSTDVYVDTCMKWSQEHLWQWSRILTKHVYWYIRWHYRFIDLFLFRLCYWLWNICLCTTNVFSTEAVDDTSVH